MRPETFVRYAERKVPRYTSYPTAPNFTAAVGEADYRRWLAALPLGTELSLYLHVPFCRAMCWYCGCHTTVTAREAPISRYLGALRREIALLADALPGRMAVGHVHFGGGSPTMMAPEELTGVVSGLRARVALPAGCEIAIEVDPRQLGDAMAEALAEAGVNRASLGVQSFDAEVQQAINRMQVYACVADAVDRLRRAGIHGINFDLIYGLPRQTTASCLDTVAQALELAPDRFAIFGYAHVPGVKLHQRRIDATTLPDASERWAQSRAMAGALMTAGYVEIGLDHFALPSDSLATAARSGRLHRNFQGYTTDGCTALLGLGASSIGRLPDGYVQNVVSISDYQTRVAAGELPVVRGYAVDADDRLRARIIERLMCNHRVDVAEACTGYGVDPDVLLSTAELPLLLADGLIELRGTTIEVRPEARALVRNVAAAFDAYLGVTAGRHAASV